MSRSRSTPVPVDRLQLMQTFVRIVEAGSLSAAAAQLGATQPTVSRRLQALEQSLGLRLLQRSTHALRLTVDGERCLGRARALLADWEALEAELRGARHEPEGCLRVVVPHAFGQQLLVRPLADFLQRHPRVRVEWLLRDDVHDFIGSGIDCAIQVGEPRDPSVVALRLGEVPRIVVAAPSLLPQGRLPTAPDELAALPWLALRTYYRHELALQHVDSGQPATVPLQPRISTDSLYALRSAALLGLGACAASTWLLADDLATGRLLHLAPQWRPAALPLYLLYPHARHQPSRLTAFVAALREAIPAALGDAARPGAA